jgi:oligopeptide transport system ATP-binding protein
VKNTESALIRVEHLKKHFPLRRKGLSGRRAVVRAVDDVSFSIARGETFALMGESGCGKTTCALTLIGLLQATSGHVYFDGTDLVTLRGEAMRRMRSRFQIVFQNPQEAMDPLMSVRKIIEEPLKIHRPDLGRRDRSRLVDEFTHSVGLQGGLLKRYPHELSGGEQQRVCICRALVLKPDFIVLDEPTSALDVSVQSRVLNLLSGLKADFSLTYLFISHDAAVIRWMADRVGVLYLGQLVELGETESVFASSAHPYSRALIQSVLTVGTHLDEKEVILAGAPPSPDAAPPGCAFTDRCRLRAAGCTHERPGLVQVASGHWVACGRSSENPDVDAKVAMP